MRFSTTFCDPFKRDIQELGEVEQGKVIETFKNLSWDDYLDKVNNADEKDIYYSPSLEFENKSNKHGVTLSYVNRGEWHVFYKRPKQIPKIFGLFSSIDNNYLTDRESLDYETVISILNAVNDNNWNSVEKIIDFKSKRQASTKESFTSVSGAIFPLIGISLIFLGIIVIDSSLLMFLVLTVPGLLILLGYRIAQSRNKAKVRQIVADKKSLCFTGKEIKLPASEIIVDGDVEEIVHKAASGKDVGGLIYDAMKDRNPAHDTKDYVGTSFLIYRKEMPSGVVEYKSDVINKQPKTVAFRLAELKHVSLYIDPDDVNNYYFDTGGL